ncbi:MAG: flagellar hook-basal body complex protein [Rhodobacteraceae bacterium]|nr:flagellar hook-basal body complex protein [Paracoccaceae bacterium]
MENAGYVTLNRQSGLAAELRVIANNVANLGTAGFRREGAIFAEHVFGLGAGTPSLSMAEGNGRIVDLSQGPLRQTGGALDLAIEGEGFFLVAAPEGPRLTRAGAFVLTPAGEIATAEGYALLDEGQAPVAVPPGAGPIAVARDGTVSAGGQPVARLGLVRPVDPGAMVHAEGTTFLPGGATEPVEAPVVLQGFIEESNVDPVAEIARMIEVQRAYELGQGLLDAEDRRIRQAVETLGGG